MAGAARRGCRPLFYRTPRRHPPRVTSRTPSAATLWIALCACTIAIVGVAALWAAISLVLGGSCGWMAILAALDAVLLLRLANWPPGRARALVALGVLALTLPVAGYFLATAQVGRGMGLRPFEALPRMSLELASLYLRANLGWIEALWAAFAGLVAWRGAR
jgi:hypothetical protein